MFNFDGELMMPEVGRWTMAGGNLSSIGTIPAGSLWLGGPQLLPGYREDILEIVGIAVTENNLALIEAKFKEMFLVKAWQFITREGLRNETAGREFRQKWSTSSAQQILDALASFDPEMLPYIWDLPERIRGFMLANATDLLDET